MVAPKRLKMIAALEREIMNVQQAFTENHEPVDNANEIISELVAGTLHNALALAAYVGLSPNDIIGLYVQALTDRLNQVTEEAQEAATKKESESSSNTAALTALSTVRRSFDKDPRYN